MPEEGNMIYTMQEDFIKDFDITVNRNVVTGKTCYEGKLEINYTYGKHSEWTGKDAAGSGLLLPDRPIAELMEHFAVEEFEGSPFNGHFAYTVRKDGNSFMLVKQILEKWERSPFGAEIQVSHFSKENALLSLEREIKKFPKLDKLLDGAVTYGAVAEKYQNSEDMTVFTEVPDWFKRVYIITQPTEKDAKLIAAIHLSDKERLVELIGNKAKEINKHRVISEWHGGYTCKKQAIKLA